MIDTMQKRKSVRCYSERPLTPEVRGEIENILQAQGKGFFGNTPRFALIERERTRQEQQVRLGTYGFIRGAAHFIAGAIARGPRAEADFGCLMENIVLEMTRLGLGTCWLGGTFSREEYAQVLHLDEKSWVPAILSLGYPAASRGTIERVVRWKAKADSRLPFEALFFEGDFTRPLSEAAAGAYARVLEMVRIAPSASNKQPWRVVKNNQGYHLILQRTPGYQKWVPSTDLQQLDMGIAMSHWEASAKALGLEGHWERISGDSRWAGNSEYIVSWIPAS